MKQNKETLKQFFETGDKPTQQQYSDLIDSYIDAKQPEGEPNRRFVIDETGEVSVTSEQQVPTYQAGTNIMIDETDPDRPIINGDTSSLVPYTGATQDVDLGEHVLKVGKEIAIPNKAKYETYLLDDSNRPIFRNIKSIWNGFSYVPVGSALGFGFKSLEEAHGLELTGFGDNTLRYNNGSYNVGVGTTSLSFNTSNYNTGVGYYTLRFNEGIYNTAVGAGAADSFNGLYLQRKAFSNTDINIATNRITLPSHNLGPNNKVILLKYKKTSGANINGFIGSGIQQYKIIDSDTIEAFNFELSGTNSTGNHTFEFQEVFNNTTVLGARAKASKSNQVVLGGPGTQEVTTQGDYVSTMPSRGMVLTTPDGTKQYRISIDDSGNIITTLI
ncbi:hypothetical protein [Tenacibaculum mesophilum]|uniref:hypothetical protein n=1 Tax=Tenacibaculum mesophilum TaxID=104268 RepID=UPI0006499F8A|nr:hypothetical protein [Tenacibaculum mesophilum]